MMMMALWIAVAAAAEPAVSADPGKPLACEAPDGLGSIYHLGHHTALLAELRMLAGLPHFATMFDLGTGIAVAF
jgi:hypothetical protein